MTSKDVKLGWAKYSRFPIWPCRTALESEIDFELKRDPRSKQVLIYFFGSNDYAYVSENNIYEFDQNFDLYCKPKNKLHDKAIQDALRWKNSPPQPLPSKSPLKSKKSLTLKEEEGEEDDVQSDSSKSSCSSGQCSCCSHSGSCTECDFSENEHKDSPHTTSKTPSPPPPPTKPPVKNSKKSPPVVSKNAATAIKLENNDNTDIKTPSPTTTTTTTTAKVSAAQSRANKQQSLNDEKSKNIVPKVKVVTKLSAKEQKKKAFRVKMMKKLGLISPMEME